jgi:hypothetical protein
MQNESLFNSRWRRDALARAPFPAEISASSLVQSHMHFLLCMVPELRPAVMYLREGLS